MSKGVPTRNELQKALIINTMTTVVGVIIGMMINNWWQQRKQTGAQIPMPGMQVGDI